ncbi:MAG: glycoside hydrolase family 1 [Verrucomicrobia bacterium]|nr:glycoside hydrolase family 1 [Verrucomicrobiota bacterium]
MSHPHRIVRAWLESVSSGIIELDRDWARRHPPRFTLGVHCPTPGGLAPAPAVVVGRLFGYSFDEAGTVTFVLPEEEGGGVDVESDRLYVGGDFNGWQAAVGHPEWELRPMEWEGERVFVWQGDASRLRVESAPRFKFVTGEHHWLTPPSGAPNGVRDESGHFNRRLDPARTGRHLWRFAIGETLNLAEPWSVSWAEGSEAPVPLVPGGFFHRLKTDLPLGAIVRGDQTVFRLFAPRARNVLLHVARGIGEVGAPLVFALTRRLDADGAAGVWEIVLDRSLHGWCYWYTIDGAFAGFDSSQRVLDPYARATVGREGPGLVLDEAWIGQGDRSFSTPAWQDLVIAETHVRDLTQHAPVKTTVDERRGFAGLRRWVESDDFYLHRLGVNCVELQPVQEFDNATVEEYHWGYMPTNYFAPESSYALAPESASGVREMQELVAAFHRRGMAVVLDVVYNHVGVPSHLERIDRLYYFEQDSTGALTNWSGCGNDLRARSAMARRLIIDSCTHLIEAYGVDGFRFDLAELLGVEVLREIETALKRVKPDVILIAEPWSFRGHIAGALRDTGWASWNDGFRDFVREYVRGNGDAARMEYFLRGSPWYFAKWPAQTVNYTESHDDRTWIDAVTERADGNGFHPTEHDRRRTHLMAALLFMSVGIPMISAGQDFLRSKHGVNNTYQRGDLNALDYRRLYRYLGTHAYFSDWIAFRRGDLGRLLRHWQRPSERFFRFFHAPGGPALAVLLNADFSQGPSRLLFAINPTLNEFTISLDTATVGDRPRQWHMLADQDRFYIGDAHGGRRPVEQQLWLPPLSCALWASRG